MDHSSECCVISHSAYINVTGSASVPLPPPPSSLLPPFQLFSLPCRCSLCYGQGCLFAQFSDDAILSVRLMGEGTNEIKAAKLLQPSVSRARRRRVAVRAEKRRDERKRIVEFETTTTTTTETTTRATEERYIFVFGYGTERKRRSRLKIETLTPPPATRILFFARRREIPRSCTLGPFRPSFCTQKIWLSAFSLFLLSCRLFFFRLALDSNLRFARTNLGCLQR